MKDGIDELKERIAKLEGKVDVILITNVAVLVIAAVLSVRMLL